MNIQVVFDEGTMSKKNEKVIYITVRETAELTRLSEISIRRYLTQKKLTRYKCGGRTLVRLADAEALIREA